MSSRGTSFLTGILVLSVIVPSVCLIAGCGDSNETGQMVTKPKEVEEGERKSMDGMKAMMKNFPKGQKKGP
jgi:nitrous oxide reductase accessory protein NosL